MEGRDGDRAPCSRRRSPRRSARRLAARRRGQRGRRHHRGWFTFETAVGARQGPPAPARRRGLDPADHADRAEGLRGAARARRARWASSTARPRPRDLARAREREEAELGARRQPYCLIIGGGQGGIALGARLKRLGVPTIIVEKNARAGDSWRNRYRRSCLHDPVWYDHLPYMPFPEHWPVFTPKDKMGDWLEMYTQGHGARLLGLTECRSARATTRQRASGRSSVERDGEALTLRPRQLVLRHRRLRPAAASPTIPGPRRFRASSTIRASIPAADLSRASAASSSAPTTRRTTSAPTSGSTAPTSP